MKKLALLFIVTFGCFVSLGNYVSGAAIDYEKTNLIIENYNVSEKKIGENIIKYNIGFSNYYGNYQNNVFLPIKLEFEKKFSGEFKIYKNEDEQGKNKLKLVKVVKINNSKELNTYFFKEWNDCHFAIKDENGTEIFLNVSNFQSGGDYYETLYILDKGKISSSVPSINEINDLFLIKQFSNIEIKKSNLSENEIKLLLLYIHSGGKLKMSEDLFKKVFSKTNTFEKKFEDNDLKSKITSYSYGFGKIYFETKYEYQENFKIPEEYIKNILVDNVIKGKFVPFYIILIIIITYFIVLIPVNFILYKRKPSKFFLLKSISIISLSFLSILIFVSFLFKGFSEIENKVQINYFKNSKIYSELYIAQFSPFGGEKYINIEKENFLPRGFYYSSFDYSNNNKKEFDFENGKIIEKISSINPSSIIFEKFYSNYEIKKSETKNEQFYSSFKDFVGNEIIEIPNKEIIEKSLNEIKKIGVSSDNSDFMKKYSFGGKENKNLIINIYY